nr:unnamed protein product [Callosobruchus chinensis]
MILTVFLSVV